MFLALFFASICQVMIKEQKLELNGEIAQQESDFSS